MNIIIPPVHSDLAASIIVQARPELVDVIVCTNDSHFSGEQLQASWDALGSRLEHLAAEWNLSTPMVIEVAEDIVRSAEVTS